MALKPSTLPAMPSIGYLLPTRERVMAGTPETGPLLSLAERDESLGFDSLWAGDSLLARPRHDPLTLLAAVAARTSRALVGTAVLLPVLRNPVVLAQQLATLDQVSGGRLVLGVGIAADNPAIRAEFAAAGVPFEKRLGRTLEAIRLWKALWSGEPVTWDGRWQVDGRTLGPTPYREGGPPIWMGTGAPAGLVRTGRHFDGWFPLGPDAATIAERWKTVQSSAAEAGRAAGDVTCATYLTLAINDDAAVAERQVDTFLEEYYSVPAAAMKRVQACYAGPAPGAREWIQSFIDAGASHVVLRFAGDHERHLETVAEIRVEAGW